MIEPLLGLDDSPEAIARGVSLGLFIGLTPTMGGQMLLALVVCTALRANRIAALALVWITNPVTVVPYYYLAYRLGLILLGQAPTTYHEFVAMLPGQGHGFWEGFLLMIGHFGWPLWAGATALALTVSIPAYPLARRYFQRRLQRRGAASPGVEGHSSEE